MMSQNRQSELDRKHAESDYEVNVKAELEIELLHEKIDPAQRQGAFAADPSGQRAVEPAGRTAQPKCDATAHRRASTHHDLRTQARACHLGYQATHGTALPSATIVDPFPRSPMTQALSTLTNHQIRLAARPVGMPKASDWSHTSEPVAEPAEGGVTLKTLALSLDPAMRGWMNEGKSYIPPVGIGEVMRAGGVGVVVASKSDKYAVGDYVSAGFGVQEYITIAKDEMKRNGLVKIDLRAGTLTQWLNVLGMPGMTGYFGLMDVGQPKAGETIVISGAAGAVGQTVGQVAKILGLRVVGIAGGPAKCEWVVKELGFDACIDYKAGAGAVRAGLKEHCTSGVDIYFDNVGGEILDDVLARINRKARIIICGAISQYNNTTAVQGPRTT